MCNKRITSNKCVLKQLCEGSKHCRILKKLCPLHCSLRCKPQYSAMHLEHGNAQAWGTNGHRLPTLKPCYLEEHVLACKLAVNGLICGAPE